jgi:hypothetical protein
MIIKNIAAKLLSATVLIALALVAAPALQAADSTELQPLADKAPALPLTATFEKVVRSEDGPPFVLKLTNTSKDALKVSVKILLSVFAHNTDKARNLPTHVIEAGKTWTIPELAALDKVIIKAEGFAPLELEVK